MFQRKTRPSAWAPIVWCRNNEIVHIVNIFAFIYRYINKKILHICYVKLNRKKVFSFADLPGYYIEYSFPLDAKVIMPGVFDMHHLCPFHNKIFPS